MKHAIVLFLFATLPAIGPANAQWANPEHRAVSELLAISGVRTSAYPSRGDRPVRPVEAYVPKGWLAEEQFICFTGEGMDNLFGVNSTADVLDGVKGYILFFRQEVDRQCGLQPAAGQPKAGQLLFKVRVEAAEGTETRSESHSSSDYYREQESSSGSEHRTFLLAVSAEIVRYGGEGQSIILAQNSFKQEVTEQTAASGSHSWTVHPPSWSRYDGWYQRYQDYYRRSGSRNHSWSQSGNLVAVKSLKDLGAQLGSLAGAAGLSRLATESQLSWVGKAEKKEIWVVRVDQVCKEIWLNCGRPKGLKEGDVLTIGAKKWYDPVDHSVVSVAGGVSLRVIRFVTTPQGSDVAICHNESLGLGEVKEGTRVDDP